MKTFKVELNELQLRAIAHCMNFALNNLETVYNTAPAAMNDLLAVLDESPFMPPAAIFHEEVLTLSELPISVVECADYDADAIHSFVL